MDNADIEFKFKQQQTIPLDISLSCKAAEILALVGPSGSGKTTLLRCLAGLYKPEFGFIRCHSEIWQQSSENIHLPAHKRKVGLVFQDYALFPHFNVLANVLEALTDLPKAERRERAMYWIKKVHLDGLETRYPRQLSGGQQQRVAVARALARDPKVLLLDEPFSAVDQVTRRRLYRELLELRQSLSIPIIVVTHDLEEATLLADRMMLLYHGQSLQIGTPYQLTTQPKSVQVARLMDQQNLFTGIIIKHTTASATTLIRWCGLTLEANYQSDYQPGSKVCWMIRPANVLLHRRDRPSKGEQENPVYGEITEYRIIGEQTHIQVKLNFQETVHMSMNVPLHVARRNKLAAGEHIGMSLLSTGIHIMPYIERHSGVHDTLIQCENP